MTNSDGIVECEISFKSPELVDRSWNFAHNEVDFGFGMLGAF